MAKLEEKFDAMMSILQQSNPQLLTVPQILIIHPQPHTTPLISTSPLSSIAPQQIERREVTNPNTNSLNSKGCCDGGNVLRAQIKDGVVVNGEDLLSFEAKVKSVERNGDETFKVFVETHKQENEEKFMIEVSTILTSIPNHQPSISGNVSKAYVPYLELRLSVRQKVKKTKLNVLMLNLKAIIGNAKLVLNGWPPPMKGKVVELNFLQPLKFGSFVIRPNNCELTDVFFDVSGEKFHAQKLVLAARALLYKALFFDGTDGEKNEIIVTDMEPKVFKAMFHFIYRNSLVDTLLGGCADTGSHGVVGKSIHAYAERNGIVTNDQLGTKLIDMYARCGCLWSATRVFDRMQRKNLMHWTAIICGLANHGHGEEAVLYSEAMKKVGVKPNDITFTGVLNACPHAGLVVEAEEYFSSMVEEFGFEPSVHHYGCMADLYARTGRLTDAYHVIENMKVEPNVVILTSLLTGCKKYSNFGIAEKVIDRVFFIQATGQRG